MGLTFSEIRYKAAENSLDKSGTQEAVTEGKEYTVSTDVSHPTNRGLSVTKQFKHTAESPEEAIRMAKKHIVSRGWKVHSATIKENVEQVDESAPDFDAPERTEEEEKRGMTPKTLNEADESAHDAYHRHLSRIDQMHKKLGKLLKDARKVAKPDWGHVGSARELHRNLQGAHWLGEATD